LEKEYVLKGGDAVMQNEVIFKISFGILAITIVSAMAYANLKAHREHGSPLVRAKNEYPPLIFLRLLLAIPVYAGLLDWLFSANKMSWSYIHIPVHMRWIGCGLVVLIGILFWWIHHTLGSNYRSTMGLHENHRLVTRGPYRFVRHPTYVTFLIFPVILFLISANWLIGSVSFVLFLMLMIVRAPIEEMELIIRFGDEYRLYMQRTNRFFPPLHHIVRPGYRR
jgi:protein-S-isoprenylcysteine O-methyltransferase Ste14